MLTGASSGLGRRLAEILIGEYGCTVYAIARSADKLSAVKAGLGENGTRLLPRPFDAGERECWERFSRELEEGGVCPGLLIDCAGILPAFGKFGNSSSSSAEDAVRVNYLSQAYAAYALLPLLKRNADPAVVNFSSAAALCPFAGVAAYCASKAASERFTECLAAEERDVYVSCVMPGFVATDIMRAQTMTERDSRLVARFSADCDKTVRLILRRLKRRKRRIVVGKDAHLMNFLFRFFPALAPKLITSVLRKSGLPLFGGI